jgi:hypothetical protein
LKKFPSGSRIQILLYFLSIKNSSLFVLCFFWNFTIFQFVIALFCFFLFTQGSVLGVLFHVHQIRLKLDCGMWT